MRPKLCFVGNDCKTHLMVSRSMDCVESQHFIKCIYFHLLSSRGASHCICKLHSPRGVVSSQSFTFHTQMTPPIFQSGK